MMISNDDARRMEQVGRLRQYLLKRALPHEVKMLHQENRLIDSFILLVILGLFFGIGLMLNRLEFSVLKVVLYLLQGLILLNIGQMTHDLLIHRKVLGNRFSAFLAEITGVLTLNPPRIYRVYHKYHHRFIGTDMDTETYKEGLKKRWHRIFFFTFPGTLFFMLSGNQGKSKSFFLKREQQEMSLGWRNFLMGLAVYSILLVFFFDFFFFAHLIPLFLTLPLWNNLRVLFEHSEQRIDECAQVGIFYRTHFWTQWPFLCNIGDCHVIHHLFPQIPFYRLPSAVNLFREDLVNYGFKTRTSIREMLRNWFILELPHRGQWNYEKRPL